MFGAKLLKTATSHTGLVIKEYLENHPMKKGFGRYAKKIIYPEGSKMRSYGIFSTITRDAGEQGKHIMINGKDRCIALGVTKPDSSFEQNIQTQLKDYIKSCNILKYRNPSIFDL